MLRRRVRRLLALVVLVAVILPRPAHAQPIVDWGAFRSHFLNFVAQVVDGYGAMRYWRDEMLSKTAAGYHALREIRQKRRDHERAAYGELAGIGQSLPDWTQYTNVCEYDVEGHSVCNVTNRASREIQGLADRVSAEIEKTFFQGVYLIEEEIRGVVSHITAAGLDQVVSPIGTHALRQLEDWQVNQVLSADNLDSLALDLDTLSQTIVDVENLDDFVASGRADQLAAYVSVVEGLAEVEITRQRLQQLRGRAVDGLDRLYFTRRDLAMVAAGKSW